MSTRWQIEADSAAVADAACRLIGIAARDAIAARKRFHVVLAGGQTPLDSYQRLAHSDQDWKRWSLYYGDERCLPAKDPDLNSTMVMRSGLADRVARHLPIPVELGCRAAANAYRDTVGAALPFDLVILGMGEDGHTASLFPDRTWPAKTVFVVKDAPKKPAERVTLGLSALQNSRAILALVTGAGKAAAVQRWRAGEALPIARVCSAEQALVIAERRCLEDPAADGAPTQGGPT